MNKVIAWLVSISILAFGSTPAPAQVPQKIVRGVKAFAVSGSKKTFMPRLMPNHLVSNATRLSGGAFVTAEMNGRFEAPTNSQIAVSTEETLKNLRINVNTAAEKALAEENLTFSQIRERIEQGRTARLAERILTYPNPQVREGMLRNEFVKVALDANATEGQIQRAAEFWRNDIDKSAATLATTPEETLKNLSSTAVPASAPLTALNNALADVAALGVFGTAQDAAVLVKAYRAAAQTPFAPFFETAVSRALLRLGATEELSQLAAEGSLETLWNGLRPQAEKRGISLPQNSGKTTLADTDSFRKVLATYGKINLLAADPSAEATAVYLNLGKTSATPAPSYKEGENTLAADLTLPPLPSAYDPAALQANSFSVISEEAAAPAATESGFLTRAANTVQAAQQSGANSSFQFFARQEKQATADRSGILYGGVPLPALWQGVKKVVSSVKKFLKPASTATERPVLTAPQEGLNGVLQRASLYLASFVMGLEVATPVIANFGTSFGLSLSDNILVAVATYLPYSVGAFLSNWLKQKIGRKASMNLGLALMGGGFTAGVTLFGLNGSFVPQPDALAHFYNILGCITLASTGGVFVHNAVGPMMTDLSAGASELALQKRNANTELSRALGMAASFAFPFLSTKVLGMDWSFTFALPIPLVAAAAAGINLARIPNTKPVVEAKPQMAVDKTALEGIKNRRAYQLTSSILNNGYIRLFKEEKGVLALLTGLMTMNAVEMSFNNGFLFLLPELTTDPSSQYLFGLVQFAAPFLIGRYLARSFLKWFPKRNMSFATLLAAAGGLAAVPLSHNVYALTAALFAAEVGISTTFTLAFARSAKNIRTQDRIVSLIVASAVSCAFGPMLLSNLAEKLMSTGLLESSSATTAAMIGVPAVLALLSAGLFKRTERLQAATEEGGSLNPEKTQKLSWLKKLIRRIFGK